MPTHVVEIRDLRSEWYSNSVDSLQSTVGCCIRLQINWKIKCPRSSAVDSHPMSRNLLSNNYCNWIYQFLYRQPNPTPQIIWHEVAIASGLVDNMLIRANRPQFCEFDTRKSLSRLRAEKNILIFQREESCW